MKQKRKVLNGYYTEALWMFLRSHLVNAAAVRKMGQLKEKTRSAASDDGKKQQLLSCS